MESLPSSSNVFLKEKLFKVENSINISIGRPINAGNGIRCTIILLIAVEILSDPRTVWTWFMNLFSLYAVIHYLYCHLIFLVTSDMPNDRKINHNLPGSAVARYAYNAAQISLFIAVHGRLVSLIHSIFNMNTLTNCSFVHFGCIKMGKLHVLTGKNTSTHR